MVFYYNIFSNVLQFIPVMAKLNFQQPLFQSSVSFDLSEISILCWFGTQETFYIFIIAETVVVYDIFVQTRIIFFSRILWFSCFKADNLTKIIQNKYVEYVHAEYVLYKY